MKVFYDKTLLRAALIEHDWNIKHTAHAIGCAAGTVQKWFKLHGLDAERPFNTNTAKGAARRAPTPQSTVIIEQHRRVTEPTPPTTPHPPEPWGLGGPATVGALTDKPDETILFLADLHGKHREQKLFNAALRVIRELEPDGLILLGDTFNFDIISQWQRARLQRMTVLEWQRALDAEIADVKRNIFEPLREAMGGRRILKVEGNHDDRLRKFLTDDLHEGWRVTKQLLGMSEYGIEYHNRAGFWLRDGYLVRHGATTSQNPSKKEYADTHGGGATGHLHRVHEWWEPFPQTGELYRHTCLPCMCRLDANYGAGNAGLMRWVQGLGAWSGSTTDPFDYTLDIGVYRNGVLRLRGERYAG